MGAAVWEREDQPTDKGGVKVSLVELDRCCDDVAIDLDCANGLPSRELEFSSLGYLVGIEDRADWYREDPAGGAGVIFGAGKFISSGCSSGVGSCVWGTGDWPGGGSCPVPGSDPDGCPEFALIPQGFEFSSEGLLQRYIECGVIRWEVNDQPMLSGGLLVEVEVWESGLLECDSSLPTFNVIKRLLEFSSIGALVSVREVDDCPYPYRGATTIGSNLAACPCGWVTTPCCSTQPGGGLCEANCLPLHLCAEITLEFSDPDGESENCPQSESFPIQWNDATQCYELATAGPIFSGCMEPASQDNVNYDCEFDLFEWCCNFMGCQCQGATGLQEFMATVGSNCWCNPCQTPGSCAASPYPSKVVNVKSPGDTCCDELLWIGESTDTFCCCWFLVPGSGSGSFARGQDTAGILQITVYDPNQSEPLDCDCQEGAPPAP